MRCLSAAMFSDVLRRPLILIISRFAEDGKEMYQHVKRTCKACRAVVFELIKPIVLRRFRFRCRRPCLIPLVLVCGRTKSTETFFCFKNSPLVLDGSPILRFGKFSKLIWIQLEHSAPGKTKESKNRNGNFHAKKALWRISTSKVTRHYPWAT